MLSAEKIQSNWERYLTEVKVNISEERSSILLPFLKKYEERFMMMHYTQFGIIRVVIWIHIQ
jgi:hypothetical protein